MNRSGGQGVRAIGGTAVAACGALSLLAASDVLAQELFEPPPVPDQYRAIETTEPILVDGRLEEAVWQSAEAITGFVQKEPVQGQSVSHPTLVRIVYDDKALYIGAICHQPRNATRVQNLQRDFSFDENDLFGIAIDGFLDRRNAVAFQTTPYGSQRDIEVIDSTEINADWDARWTVKTHIEDDRWSAEIAIPWRNLRYPDGADRLGVILSRNIRSLNEVTSAPAVPRAFSVYRMAYQAELVGIETPAPSTNVQLNPYALVQRLDNGDTPAPTEQELGGELKWAFSQNSVLDLTVNTDFAQADVDRQAVNLERFSVFFPERRQFFLENANIFNTSVTNWIRPFFSRRIGLDDTGNPIPLDGGLRLTSRSSAQELGFLAMQQQQLGTSPQSRFGVLRYSRNVAGQSRIGGMVTYRHDDALSADGISLAENRNTTFTIDALWRPEQSWGMQAMLSASHDDLTGDGIGSQFWAFYENNLVYIGLLEYFNHDYNPGIGLEILDTNYVMHSPAISLDLRSERLPDSIRSYNPGVEAYIFQSSDNGDLLFGYAPIRPLRLHFHNGAEIRAVIEPNWQRLTEPFSPAGIEIAPGDYDYTRYRFKAETDQSAALAAGVEVETGDYFDGELTTYTLSGRYAPMPHIELSADVEINRIRGLGISQQDENTRLYSANVRLAPNPRLQFNAFYEWNSLVDRGVWNLRLAWEYQPLSYLYLVYNRSDTDNRQAPFERRDTRLIAKFTYLFEA